MQFDNGGKPTVIDGPFAETKELISGYWIIDVKSLDEAVSWAKRIPQLNGQGPKNIEIRRTSKRKISRTCQQPQS